MTCPICNDEFIPARGNQKYCSQGCRLRSNNDRGLRRKREVAKNCQNMAKFRHFLRNESEFGVI